VPRPDKPLRFFADRSLGRFQVPDGLRAAGLDIVTLSERYGVPKDETVKDETWLKEAGRRAEVVLMKDRKIRYRSTELSALREHEVRAFCLTNGNLTGSEMIEYFTANLTQILVACEERGPFIYIVHARTIEKLSIV
jgi:hypothetical protein